MGAISNVRITSGTGALTQGALTQTATGGPITTTLQPLAPIAIINDGDGAGVFEGVTSGGSYLFKSFIAGSGIVLTTTNTGITIATNGSSAGGSFNGSLAAVAISGSYTDLINKPTITSALRTLTDVVASMMPTNGQVLTFDGTKWNAVTPAGGGGGASALSALTDVSIPSPATGQVLEYNGSSWIAATPSGSATLPVGTPQTFFFDVLITSSAPSSTTNVPSLWSAVVDTATNNVNVTVDSSLTGKIPFSVSYHFMLTDNTGTPIPTAFGIMNIGTATISGGGFLSYDTTVSNKFTLNNLTNTNTGFGLSGSGALIRVYVMFV
jgi:hypothetical protein